MKNAIILSSLVLVTLSVAQDSLISIPVGLCAGILGDATCKQTASAPGGLIDVPLNACIAALGDAKCQQASTASGDQESLISVPINICIGVLGDVTCNQKATAPGGLIDIPLNLCLAVLGDADCKQNAGGPGSPVIGTATGIISQAPTVIPTVPTMATSTPCTTTIESSTTDMAETTVPVVIPMTSIHAPKPISEISSVTSIVTLTGSESPITYIHETSTSTSCAEKPAMATPSSATTLTSAVVPVSAPTTLILLPSAGAVAPTGVVPHGSSQPATAVTPLYTGAADHLKISSAVAAIGLMAAMGFQL